ncbi:hypothetical protein HN51_071250 [Arachis hypogaea]|uniref:Uncharacterized protein n=2 Tax=Arachis TaxID=3817 RepID=A0A445D4D7_ARAHY|nr:uncharacterized protein LOC107489980 [Arachis duranensis]XP_016203936.1 uncharacterized protein LOC107644563 [Arachis ipaensis]XP_025653343.1 uncharacterized protein LOC112749298 [Arachis hypogaea]XP_025702984.1 uncharacterized protein LOC112803723 [Arachis hypogaea]XP_057760782.1 uncharacterized protein LOC130981181 [Arachis stenosperma]QHO13834.1 uncharacterized protein DS421_15g518900 [Arachis hypogaea]RYR07106.1 hypothetical protein Ahy_B05g074424 [Arachis hypogaea]RYR57894.1 hypothet
MGNYISCTLAGPGSKNSRGIKVIFPSGEIQQFQEPIKAAELMLEMPSFFVVNTRSLQIGRRFSALNADEELEFSNVYVMIPMKKLNSAVSAADMGALLITANAAAKRASGGRKVRMIMPEYDADSRENDMRIMESPSQPKLNLDDIEEYSSPEVMHRLSLCRSKKPLLETIAEEPVCSR